MGWRANIGWLDGDHGHVFRLRATTRPICGQRRWPGSHVACACLADHEGPHESAEGDQWEGDDSE